MTLDPKGLTARITEYLTNGGLINPELMEHDRVRDLLVDCRAYLSAVPSDVTGLVERLNIKAGVMEMGERIAWGSDTALMREAATALSALSARPHPNETLERAADADARLGIKAEMLLELYRRHMSEAQKDIHGRERERLFSMINDFEWAFPEVKARVDELYPQEPTHD